MHSLNFLQNKIVYNVDHVTAAIADCKGEQEQLSCNLQNVKKAIENACNRYVEKIQLHAAQLLDDAHCSYQEKYKVLAQRIMDLEESLLDYSKSLEQARQSNEEEARNLLNKVINKTILKSDVDTSFAQELVFEENVIHQLDFGRVVSRKKKNSCSFTDSDFEIVPQRREMAPFEKENDIELKVKSIEMYHLTSESASVEERKDLDDIEVELSDMNLIKVKKVTREDAPVRNDFSQWLRVDPARESTAMDYSSSEKEISVDSDIDSKVKCWLISCDRESRDMPWNNTLDDRISVSMEPTSALAYLNDIPMSSWLLHVETDESSRDEECLNMRETSSSEWLIQRSYSDQSFMTSSHVNQVTSQNSLDASDINDTPHFLKHISFIRSQPYEAYLHPKSVEKKKKPSFCDWLVGNSNERCADCSDSCTFSSNLSSNWLKTATDW